MLNGENITFALSSSSIMLVYRLTLNLTLDTLKVFKDSPIFATLQLTREAQYTNNNVARMCFISICKCNPIENMQNKIWPSNFIQFYSLGETVSVWSFISLYMSTKFFLEVSCFFFYHFIVTKVNTSSMKSSATGNDVS